VEETKRYLEEHPELSNEKSELLAIYLTEYEDPSEDFPHGSALTILENCELSEEEIKAETALIDQKLVEAISFTPMVGTDITMLFTNPGTTMRFRAPEGYKFAKMMFYDYRNSYFLLDTEEEVEAVRYGTTHKDTHKIWIPTTPKVNQNGLDCWEGDETNILFNSAAYFKGNFMKIDMRLVPDAASAIRETAAKAAGEAVYDLQGRQVKTAQKGIYVTGGKKVVR
jgi:hypothetical protein